ncbi:hypothetical protein GCM10010406_20530 [Streptomyces thermolineatus]|uniref:Histidine kinase/HSP90-like ATPase domain-containing protein n=1 Tax=Streptomyces thermolineatus TaxID=44033 RepID=A0ABP5YVM6_9ACTN
MAAHHQLAFTVASTTAAVRQARHRVVAGIRSWGIRLDAEALDGIELVASELITNAVLHAPAGPITVSARYEGPTLVVEVYDATVVIPLTEPITSDAERGRGLYLVAMLADRHGATLTTTGKRCWAEFDVPGDSGGRQTSRDSGGGQHLLSGLTDHRTRRSRSRAPRSVAHADEGEASGSRLTAGRAAGRPPVGQRVDSIPQI